MLWLITLATVPLSVRAMLPVLGTEIIFPAEPLLASLAAWNITARFRATGLRESVRLLARSRLGWIGVSWIALHATSAVFSSHPLVSWKSTLVQAVYVVALLPITRGGVEALRSAWQGRRQVHDLAFLAVIAFTLTWASIHGLDRMAMNFSAYPFYMDHTLYAAVLCFVLFRFIGLLNDARRDKPRDMRLLCLAVLTAALGLALVLSYSRAAWLGAASAFVLLAFVRAGVKRAILALIGLSVTAWLLFTFTPLSAYVSQWRHYASQDHGMGPLRTLLSIANTRSDTNNRDRIIRWKASWRMFKDRPLVGTGAGTWPLHCLSHMTAAEIQQVHGPLPPALPAPVPALRLGEHLHFRDHAGGTASNAGSAHSEYLLALSERGLGGLVWWMVVVGLVSRRTIGHLREAATTSDNAHAWAMGLALIAFLVHAVFNNFLDDCKAAVLFWPCLALLLAPRDHSD
jgi:O-antigen ligase